MVVDEQGVILPSYCVRDGGPFQGERFHVPKLDQSWASLPTTVDLLARSESTSTTLIWGVKRSPNKEVKVRFVVRKNVKGYWTVPLWLHPKPSWVDFLLWCTTTETAFCAQRDIRFIAQPSTQSTGNVYLYVQA